MMRIHSGGRSERACEVRSHIGRLARSSSLCVECSSTASRTLLRLSPIEPDEPHRGVPEDDVRGDAGLEGLEGVGGADLCWRFETAQLHDVCARCCSARACCCRRPSLAARRPRQGPASRARHARWVSREMRAAQGTFLHGAGGRDSDGHGFGTVLAASSPILENPEGPSASRCRSCGGLCELPCADREL